MLLLPELFSGLHVVQDPQNINSGWYAVAKEFLEGFRAGLEASSEASVGSIIL